MKNGIKVLKIQLSKDQTVVADQCVLAESFFDRLKGLLGKKELKEGEGLLLKPCSDIHMWFMNIPIDVVFIKREFFFGNPEVIRVTSVKENLKPWKLLPVMDRRANETIELPAGTIQRCGIHPGDELCIS